MDISKIKKGDKLKLKGGNIVLDVIEVGIEWRSSKTYVATYNDVTNTTKTLVDASGYELV